MKLTFSIPAYNERENISKCLASIFEDAKRAGRTKDIEIIVVDNASTDDTGKIAGSFPDVIVLREPKKGLVAARHCGYLHATGDIIACVDSDTILPEGWIARVFREFSADEKLIALSGPHKYYDLNGATRLLVDIFYRAGYLLHLFNHYVLRSGAILQGGNFVVRKKVLDTIGGHAVDPSLDFYGEDTDIARRISPYGKVKFTFDFPIYTSGRRLVSEGILRMGARYAINHVWILAFKKPFSKSSKDIR